VEIGLCTYAIIGVIVGLIVAAITFEENDDFRTVGDFLDLALIAVLASIVLWPIYVLQALSSIKIKRK